MHPSKQKDNIQISLFLKLSTPDSVESVSIFGDNEVTGNFDIKKSISLQSTENSFGKIWTLQINMPCTFGPLNYKYIINGKEEFLKKNRSLNLTGFSISIYDKLSEDTLEWLQQNNNNQLNQKEEGTNKKKNTREIVQQIIDMKKIHKVIMNTKWLNNNFELRIQTSETQFRAIEQEEIYNEEKHNNKYVIKFRPHHDISISSSSQYLIFCACSINELSFWADIYQDEKKITSVFVSSNSLMNLHGQLNFPVVDYERGIELGLLYINFLVITPFKHQLNTIESISEGDLYDNADKLIGNLAQEPMYIGHRGSGMTTNPNKKHIFIENTLVSFLAAKKSGGDFIEFDVQLTKDLVPVIAHDEEIMIPTKTIDGKDTVVLVPVNKIEFATLQKLKPYTLKGSVNGEIQIEEKNDSHLNDSHSFKRNGSIESIYNLPNIYGDTKNLTESILESSSGQNKQKKKLKKKEKKKDLNSSSSHTSEPITNGNKTNGHHEEETLENEFWKISNVFPSLEQLFRLLPQSVGFNIEIKYPDEEEYAKYLSSIERNKYVDRILKVIFDNHQNNRKVFISSFDPLICLLCSQKQLRYPVFFLTSGGTELYSDSRKNSITEAVSFCNELNLAGIVTSSEIFLDENNFKYIDDIHKHGLLILTYGSYNSDPSFIDKQIDNGVNACIVDTIHSVKASTKKKNIVSKSKKIEDYRNNPYLNRLRHTVNFKLEDKLSTEPNLENKKKK
eukprot:TRINITY_DN5704_c0_g1_i1.p1 TRINITY_DN5704_c0_g1~~TRINITY_DN5704_c0_g1_i1.p1  ORF type:complete len:731 (+),score=223.34 TRINITY_DN5704_c0_g1_i1:61-2253(+)